jgi:hypothetical protein
VTPIRTTYEKPLPRAGLETLSRLQDREIASIVEAVTDGRLVGVVDHKAGEIVGALMPEYADQLCADTNDNRFDASSYLAQNLMELQNELVTLRQIVKEVMAEKEPGDFQYRIDDCIYDAESFLESANSVVEEM